ncbi:MAG: protein translocase subunit SecF [Chloroflexota bacterium]|nr:protein translocase subunit SecF [Chloroflexota bacterium]
MFDLVGKRRWYFLISGIIILLSIAAMVYSTISYGAPVRLGVDFTGGGLFVLRFQEEATEDGIRRVFEANRFDDPVIQQLGAHEENAWQVRTSFATQSQVTEIQDQLESEVAPIDRGTSSYDSVNPSAGVKLLQAVALAVAVTLILGSLFIWYSSQRMPHAFRYGLCALIVMLHNVLVTTGFFAIMGILIGWKVDTFVLIAILAVVGFSVHDLVIVLDRIRKNSLRRRGESFETLANRSVLETVNRSLITQLSVTFIVAAVLFFDGAAVGKLLSTLLVGMIGAAYASLCIAVPLLVVWETGEFGFRRERSATV